MVEVFGMGFVFDCCDVLKIVFVWFGDFELIEVGLFISVEEKMFYDWFWGWLMIFI